jgi:hypothetical protein
LDEELVQDFDGGPPFGRQNDSSQPEAADRVVALSGADSCGFGEGHELRLLD